MNPSLCSSFWLRHGAYSTSWSVCMHDCPMLYDHYPYYSRPHNLFKQYSIYLQLQMHHAVCIRPNECCIKWICKYWATFFSEDLIRHVVDCLKGLAPLSACHTNRETLTERYWMWLFSGRAPPIRATLEVSRTCFTWAACSILYSSPDVSCAHPVLAAGCMFKDATYLHLVRKLREESNRSKLFTHMP